MTLRVIDTDEQFFKSFPTRKTMIRPARDGEYRGEFASLGPHNADRRRVLCWRADPQPGFSRGMVLKTPMLLFSDEEIANEDSVLLPILRDIMQEARDANGGKR